MKNKLINNDMYLLLIDEEAEICQMDLYLDVDCGVVTRATLTSDQYDGCKKIIAYYPLTEGAKELDLPLLPSLFEEEPLMKQASKLRELRGYHKDNHYSFCGGFIEGYKAAQSSNKRFSLEEMKRALSEAFKASQEDYQITADEIIQSISTQKLPVDFEPEYEYQNKDTLQWGVYYPFASSALDVRLKTVTNSAGKKEIVGTYKY